MEQKTRGLIICGIAILLTVFLNAQGVLAEEERTPQEEVRITIAPAVPERGGLLLRQGQLELQPQFRYALQTDNVFAVSGLAVLPAIVIGTIDVEKSELDVLEVSLTSRYGILNDLQFEVRLPWRYSHRRVSPTIGTGDDDTTDDTGIGDVEAALSYQLFREKGARPALVTALRVRTPTGRDPFDLDEDELPTGTGFWGIQGIINAVKVRDPIVLFANIGYTWNIEDEVDFDLPDNPPVGDVTIDPGDVIEWGLGFAYAISPEFSLNAAYVHRLSFRSRVTDSDNEAVVDTGKISGSRLNIPELKLGTVWAYSRGFFIDFNVSIGLSDDAPDFTAQVGFPIRFDLF